MAKQSTTKKEETKTEEKKEQKNLWEDLDKDTKAMQLDNGVLIHAFGSSVFVPDQKVRNIKQSLEN